jgi:hypothetical protein
MYCQAGIRAEINVVETILWGKVGCYLLFGLPVIPIQSVRFTAHTTRFHASCFSQSIARPLMLCLTQKPVSGTRFTAPRPAIKTGMTGLVSDFSSSNRSPDLH